MTSRAWTFTVNNYTEREQTHIDELTSDKRFRYVCYGVEIGEQGTPHLQGYLELSTTMRLKGLKNINGLARAHLEARKGTREQARTYCMKDGDFHEFGSWLAGGQGSRTDWHELHAIIASGASFHDIAEQFPEQAIKYASGIQTCLRHAKQATGEARLHHEFKDFKPYKWQQTLINDLQKKPNPRKVIWFVDPEGNKGKTHMARYLCATEKACVLSNCRSADAAHAYNGERVVVFDFTRETEERINYSIIEQIKNGLIFSPKYDSCTKVHSIPHVVCLSNFSPDKSKLSIDRWDIRTLTDDSTLHQIVPEDALMTPVSEAFDAYTGLPLLDEVDQLINELATEVNITFRCQETYDLPPTLTTVADVIMITADHSDQVTLRDELDTTGAGNTVSAPDSPRFSDEERKFEYFCNALEDDEFESCEEHPDIETETDDEESSFDEFDDSMII